MSIEKALADLQKAVEANTAALASIAGAAKTAGGNKPAGAKDTSKPKTISDDDVRAAVGGYLSSGDAAGKADRKEKVTAILTHYGAKLATELAADKREAALADVALLKEGKLPDYMETADADDDMLG